MAHNDDLDESDEPGLDAEELMHLALKAMAQDRDDDAILFLKHALQLSPEEGRLHYLLGAVHAQLGMGERAIREIERALSYDPTLGTARFQLGLLYMSNDQEALARKAWMPLDELDADNALRLFKEGMTRFMDEDYAGAVGLLQRGIELNEEVESLNDNMRQVLEQAQAMLEAGDAPAEAITPRGAELDRDGRDPAAQQHVLLAGYRKRDTEK